MGLKFSKSTDAEHEIKLDSYLISSVWKSRSAPAGGKAKFHVVTAFVGNGAKIKISGKTSDGDSLGEISSTIKNNSFVGELDIPADAEIGQMAHFEVELSANSLSGESGRIPITPQITVSNLRWSEKEARRGDILKLNADVRGCRDNTEAKVTIFEYDSDGVHDKIVELPAEVKENKIEIEWEYEYHEDTDEIPTQEEMDKYGGSYNPPEYFFVVEIEGIKFGQEQESKILTFKDFFEIRIVDRESHPMTDRDYAVTLPDGTEKKGKTDSNGNIKIDNIPPGKCKVDFPTPENDDEDNEF